MVGDDPVIALGGIIGSNSKIGTSDCCNFLLK